MTDLEEFNKFIHCHFAALLGCWTNTIEWSAEKTLTKRRVFSFSPITNSKVLRLLYNLKRTLKKSLRAFWIILSGFLIPCLCSAHIKHYTRSRFSVPGNPDNRYSPEWLLFTTRLTVARQVTDRRQKKGIRTLGDALALCVLFPP